MGQAATYGQGHPPTLLTHASPGAGVCRPWRVCPGLGGYSGSGLGIGVTQVWPQTCPLLPVSKAWPRASHRDSKFSVVTSQGRGWPCLRVCAEEDVPAVRAHFRPHFPVSCLRPWGHSFNPNSSQSRVPSSPRPIREKLSLTRELNSTPTLKNSCLFSSRALFNWMSFEKALTSQ